MADNEHESCKYETRNSKLCKFSKMNSMSRQKLQNLRLGFHLGPKSKIPKVHQPVLIPSNEAMRLG